MPTPDPRKNKMTDREQAGRAVEAASNVGKTFLNRDPWSSVALSRTSRRVTRALLVAHASGISDELDPVASSDILWRLCRETENQIGAASFVANVDLDLSSLTA